MGALQGWNREGVTEGGSSAYANCSASHATRTQSGVAAREAWTSINRQDLFALLERFG
jgi:hypothetical protein